MTEKNDHGEQLDEESIIEILWGKFGLKQKSDPFNDDAAWMKNSGKQRGLLVAKADMMVATTDAPKQMTAEQIARKSVVACVSDLAAKGVKPSYCLLSLGIPKELAKREFVSGLAEGFARAEREYGLKIIGGDTNATLLDPVIDCSIFGFSDSVVKRSGAKEGDLIGVSGNFGHQSAGLFILLGRAQSSDPDFASVATRSVLEPKARLELGLKASKYLSSSIDSSDGLAISLYHLAEASLVDFELKSLPIQHGVEKFAGENELDPQDLALFGGEEYELVCTYNPRYETRLEKLGISKIGRVLGKNRAGEPKVYFNNQTIPRRGWLHFSSESDQ